MALPPLQPLPHLARLLAPDETLIYTAKLHPLYGWPWLLAALVAGLPAFLGLSFGLWSIPPAVMLFIIYLLPFKHFELAVTSKRLLLRYGRFGTVLNDIPPEHINHWRLQQGLFSDLLHYGHLTIYLVAGRELRVLPLKFLWHPLTLLEALETLTLPADSKK
jgi:hypothetical protein